MCQRVLNLLEAGHLRVKEVVIKRIAVVKLGVTPIKLDYSNGGGSGRSSIAVKVRADTAKLTNLIVAGFEES